TSASIRAARSDNLLDGVLEQVGAIPHRIAGRLAHPQPLSVMQRAHRLEVRRQAEWHHELDAAVAVAKQRRPVADPKQGTDAVATPDVEDRAGRLGARRPDVAAKPDR